jgi:hypothetical protein
MLRESLNPTEIKTELYMKEFKFNIFTRFAFRGEAEKQKNNPVNPYHLNFGGNEGTNWRNVDFVPVPDAPPGELLTVFAGKFIKTGRTVTKNSKHKAPEDIYPVF